jgi:hypothetical protein
MEVTLYMGYTKTVRRDLTNKCHLVEVTTGYERKSLCGAMITKWVTRYGSDEPVPYADHWDDKYDMCQHCRVKHEEDKG